MTLGPFSFPLAPVILLCSIVIAAVAGHLFTRDTRDTRAFDRALTWTLVAAFGVARLSFVLGYLPAYRGHMLSMLDLRDRGFDLVPGLVAGGLVFLLFVARGASVRKPLALAWLAGLVAFGVASAAVKAPAQRDTLPLLTLTDVHGQVQSLHAPGGAPMVINLWATWCPPCQAEMPALAAAQSAHPGIDMMFVNQGETTAAVQQFLDDHGLRIDHVLMDPRLQLARSIRVTGYPTTLFYDAQGHLLATHLGPFSAATFARAVREFYGQ
jgi:thiol-disulfide isomerase/thioredoxin